MATNRTHWYYIGTVYDDLQNGRRRRRRTLKGRLTGSKRDFFLTMPYQAWILMEATKLQGAWYIRVLLGGTGRRIGRDGYFVRLARGWPMAVAGPHPVG